MKILVTGASGQLGAEIRNLSKSSEHDFIFTDLKASEEGVVILDVTDETQVDNEVADGVDVIVNCAAYTNVNAAEADEETAYKVNAYAAGLLASAASRNGAHLIHISTDYVFDGKANTPYQEDFQPAPINAYGRTKLAGEQKVIESGCRYMIFRTSWLYSKHGHNFYNTMAEKCAGMPQVNVVVDQIGTPTFAGDLAFLIMHIIEEGLLDRTGLYNYSNEGVASWYDFAKEINDSLGYSCRVVPCCSSDYPSAAERPAYSVLDKKKVKDTFGIEIPHWRESLRLMTTEL